MSDAFDIQFISQNRKPQCKPDPAYPQGIDVDVSRGSRPACATDLPYPAACIGTFVVICKTCKTKVAITAAGRADDPRTALIACKRKPS